MNSEELSFIYGFDISRDVAHFKSAPEHVQRNAECNVVDVIYESFVVPGDQDYLMARLLAQKGLPRGFYWAAAQATEKYLKAFLLMNGEDVRRFRSHPINALFTTSCKIDAELVDIEISPHPSICVEPSVSHHLKKFTIKDFMAELERHGNANNRYNETGVDYNTGHLFAMDSMAFHVRGKIGAAPIHKSLDKLDHYLIEIFAANNPWFHSDKNHPPIVIPSKEFPIQYSSSVTKLDFLKKNQGNLANKIALQWLSRKMKFGQI